MLEGGVCAHMPRFCMPVWLTIDMQKALGLKSLPSATATPEIK